MHVGMDLPTNDVRWNTKSKKKYELSLRRIKNDGQSKRNCPIEGDRIRPPKKIDKTTESDDSENFKLRLSDSFAIEDTYDEGKSNSDKVTDVSDTEVILISDSSEDGTPKKLDRITAKSWDSSRRGIRKSTSAPDCAYQVKSSDSDDTDEKNGQNSANAGSKALSVNGWQRKCSILYTSDEDITNDESGFSRDRRKNPSHRSRNDNVKSRSSSAVAKNVEDRDEKLSSISEKFKGLLNEKNSPVDKSDVRQNIFYKGNDTDVKSRITPTTARNNGDAKKKFISSCDRLRKIFNDESALDTECETRSDARGNTMEEAGDKENKSRVTPAATRNNGNSGKKLISNSERFRRLYNDAGGSEMESGIGSDRRYDIFDEVNDQENITRVTPTQTKNFANVEKKLISSSEKFRSILTDNECNVDKRMKTKCSTEISKKFDEWKRTPVSEKKKIQTPTLTGTNETKRTPISEKLSSRTVVLTKKDARQILKVIKSKKAVYESPKITEKSDVTDENESDASDIEDSSPEPCVRITENIENNKPIVIDETDSDSDDKVIRGSRIDSWKPQKTHVTRFLEPAINDDASVVMSEKKKLEVAKWLLTNTADSTDDGSISVISGSKTGSPNSGNSSLERLEQNYETPNNRDRFKNIFTVDSVDRPITPSNSTKSRKNVRQTTIDNFVMKSKDGTKNILTPVNTTTMKKKRDLVNPIVTEATENLGIMDCADILDKLYGNVWRSKADDLLPSSEPRKTNIRRQDKAVQTERKIKPRSKNILRKTSGSSSQDDDFDAFVKNIKPNLNSTKKSVKTIDRRGRNLKNDSPSSAESGGETTFLTALTNPRISNIRKITDRKTPASLAIQRARAICDSDTEDENSKNEDHRKQLSFSDDDDSSTSEYDPNDVLPPKTIAKTADPSKTPKDYTKPSKSTSTRTLTDKSKNFLTSLGSNVPINEAHPDAKKYRQNYKTTKDELCKHLYKLFNDKVFDDKLPKDMTVEWNVRMRGTAGYCYNKRSVKALGGVTRSSRIVLATKILDTPDRLRDTLIHEMCHAAAWLINEVSDGHGPFWKGWASKAMRAFPELPPIQRCHDYKIKTKFTYRCTGCGYSVGRHSKSLDIEKKRCGHCYGKFELLINKVTKTGLVQVRTPVSRQPTGFALFVKENYHSVKKDRNGVAHKEVMQILGQQFSAIKISKKANNFDDDNIDDDERS